MDVNASRPRILRAIWRAAGLLLAGLPLLASASSKRPNVLFIAADDLRPEPGCYGVTGWIDRRHPDAEAFAVELYVRTRDPGEMENIADRPWHAALLEPLHAQRRRGWRGAIPKSHS